MRDCKRQNDNCGALKMGIQIVTAPVSSPQGQTEVWYNEVGSNTTTAATTLTTLATQIIPAGSLTAGIIQVNGAVMAREWDNLKIEIHLNGVLITGAASQYAYTAPASSVYISGLAFGYAEGLSLTADNTITLKASKTNVDNRNAQGTLTIRGY